MNKDREVVLLRSPDEVKADVYQRMPNLDDQTLLNLQEDIEENGILHPLFLDENRVVIDGHHRYMCWQNLHQKGVDVTPVIGFMFKGVSESEARDMAISVNTQRRGSLKLDEQEDLVRALWSELDKDFRKQYGDDPEQATNYSFKRVARMVGISEARARAIRDDLVRERKILKPRWTYHPGAFGGQQRQRSRELETTFSPEATIVASGEPLEWADAPPFVNIGSHYVPLAKLDPETTVADIQYSHRNKVPLPAYPHRSPEEKAFDKLVAARRSLRALVPAKVADVPSDLHQAKQELGSFKVMLNWMNEFYVELEKKSRGYLRSVR